MNQAAKYLGQRLFSKKITIVWTHTDTHTHTHIRPAAVGGPLKWSLIKPIIAEKSWQGYAKPVRKESMAVYGGKALWNAWSERVRDWWMMRDGENNEMLPVNLPQQPLTNTINHFILIGCAWIRRCRLCPFIITGFLIINLLTEMACHKTSNISFLFYMIAVIQDLDTSPVVVMVRCSL